MMPFRITTSAGLTLLQPAAKRTQREINNASRIGKLYREQTPLLSRGGVAAPVIRSREAPLMAQTGRCWTTEWFLLTSTTPAAATASAFPSSAEEGSLRKFFTALHASDTFPSVRL